MKNKNRFKKGFSIGEVLIALFVLSFGILAAIYLMTGSLKDSMRARDLLVAAMLSQEGSELMKNIRDNNITEKNLNTGERLDVFTNFPTGSDECIVDYNYDVNNSNNQGSFIGTALNCNSPSFDLYLRSNKGIKFYTHKNSSIHTKFKRKIFIKSVSSDTKELLSIVVWDGVDFPNNNKIKEECTIGKNCMYDETTLTSWLNYSE